MKLQSLFSLSSVAIGTIAALPSDSHDPSIARRSFASISRLFLGYGSHYTPTLGACGWENSSSDLVVAISPHLYGSTSQSSQSPLCGLCVLVKGPRSYVKAKVAGECIACNSGDLELSESAYSRIASLDTNRVSISWTLVAC
ncbi:hypothetical protein GQ54DRAFT_310823 [Martensiomyces pterosporus]|nr:hypothetical protein GQ54DRAFT_310823 [Martensiomyces pterosporus]